MPPRTTRWVKGTEELRQFDLFGAMIGATNSEDESRYLLLGIEETTLGEIKEKAQS